MTERDININWELAVTSKHIHMDNFFKKIYNMCVYIYIYIYLIEHNRQFLSAYFKCT